MKLLSLLLILSLGLACNKKDDDDEVSTTSELEGHWLTNCLPAGGSDSIKIGFRVDNGTVSSYMAGYIGVTDCSNTAVLLHPDSGDPITDYVTGDDLTYLTISDSPDDFSVSLSSDPLEVDPDNFNVTYKVNDDQIEILILDDVTTSAGDDWADWTAISDVAGFVADPEGFSGDDVTGNNAKYTLTRVESPF